VHNGKQNVAAVAASPCEARSWHARVASPTGRRLQKSNTQNRDVVCACKKTGRKIRFSSRVEVRGCDPESFRGRYQASGLNASFSSL